MQLTKTTFFLGCLVGGLGAALAPLLFSSLHAENQLLPFQGRLTDPSGTALADGTKVVEFKIYDAPTGGSVKWSGEVHKLSVNGGLVNTMLGSKASLSNVDFSTPCYLQITVDANGDNQITLADPPLLPRQSVVPAIYASVAGDSRKLAGSDWSALLVDSSGNPVNTPTTGFIQGSKLQSGSVASSQISDGAITQIKIAPNAVGTGQLLDASVSGSKIADKTIPLSKFAALTIGQFNVPVGGLAISPANASDGGASAFPEKNINALTVSLSMSGRPVDVSLYANPNETVSSHSGLYVGSAPGSGIQGRIRFYRTEINSSGSLLDQTKTLTQLFYIYRDSVGDSFSLPVAMFRCLDLTAAQGKTYQYTVTIEGAGTWANPGTDRLYLSNAVLVAREL